jgi:hypothetical protein
LQHSPIVLKNNRICVEIARPGSIYQGSRFDWTGWIINVTLDGKHTFTAHESEHSGVGSGGSGLCNEFGLLTPLGYDDCAPGEAFPKIGVGLLTKPDENGYNFMRSYAIQQFPMEVNRTAHSVVFEVKPHNCRGYEFTLKKTLSIEENRLYIHYDLHNSGQILLQTEEYNHNFVALDGKPIGSGYVLRLPFEVDAEVLPKEITGEGQELRWTSTPQEAFYCKFTELPNKSKNKWTLIHEQSGVGMQETLHTRLNYFALWGQSHVVCPEMFTNISLPPNESMQWAREYCFFAPLP